MTKKVLSAMKLDDFNNEDIRKERLQWMKENMSKEQIIKYNSDKKHFHNMYYEYLKDEFAKLPTYERLSKGCEIDYDNFTFTEIDKNQEDTDIQRLERLQWMNSSSWNNKDKEKYLNSKEYYDSIPFECLKNFFGYIARKKEKRIRDFDILEKKNQVRRELRIQQHKNREIEREKRAKEGKLSNDLMFRHRRISTTKIETLETNKFIMGSFFIYYRSKECSFIEQNQELFFNKVFNFTKIFKIKVVCFFQPKDFNTKFLMKYCAKNLEEQPKIERFNKKILQIQIPEYNITFKNIELFLEIFPDEFKYDKDGIVSQTMNSDYTPIFKPKVYKNHIKYDILKMLNSRKNYLELKGFELLREKIQYDTLELYKAIIPHHLNSYLFVKFKKKYTQSPFAEIDKEYKKGEKKDKKMI